MMADRPFPAQLPAMVMIRPVVVMTDDIARRVAADPDVTFAP